MKRCCRLVRRELDRLIARPLSDAQLRKAKQQLRGQLTIAADNREQFALDFARTFLHHNETRDIDRLLQHIDRLTAAELQQVANDMFAPDHMLTLIYQ